MKKYPIIANSDSLQEMLNNLRQSGVTWTKALLASDQKMHNLCVFLIDGEKTIVSGFKPNMNSQLFELLYSNIVTIDNWITADHVENFAIYDNGFIPEKITVTKLNKRTFRHLLERPIRPKATGRKGEISPNTARKVFQQSHMRCMFEGCAKRLDLHSLKGEKGYYGYLAHIIPASENGPRGNEATTNECELLVNNPSNIMLLCDECHRLIDRVAVSEYTRHVLENMRENFLNAAASCLEQLAFKPAPVAEFLWPIGTNHYGVPSPMEIQNCLSPLKIRWNLIKHTIADKNSDYNDTKSKKFWRNAPDLLELAKIKLQSLVADNPTLGLFAGGPMPALIALGALVGNKINITPMLNTRSTGQWCWSSSEPKGQQFQILGLDEFKNSTDLVLQLNLTNKTAPQDEKRKQLEQDINCGSIIVEANKLGNDCINHHQDALLFQNEMTKMLTHIKSYGIKRVHVLPCASNLICVHFGRSIEQYSPELRIYDFLNDENGDTSIYPVLDITPSNEGVKIKSVAE